MDMNVEGEILLWKSVIEVSERVCAWPTSLCRGGRQNGLSGVGDDTVIDSLVIRVLPSGTSMP